MRGRLYREEASAQLGGLDMTPAQLRAVERIILSGCGTACHAAMVGEYLIEALAHIPSEVEFASEFRYRNMPRRRDTLVFVRQPERRDRRHARRPARGPAQRPSRARHLQQRRPRPSPARATAASTCTPARRSASRRRNHSPASHHPRRCSRCCSAACGISARARASRSSTNSRPSPTRSAASSRRTTTSKPSPGNMRTPGHDVPRPAVQLSRRARRRAEDEGDQLHPRQRPPERGAEARRHRADQPARRRASSSRPTTPSSRRTSATSRKSARAGGPIIAIGTEGRTELERARRRRHLHSARAPTTSARSSPASRSNSSPTTPPSHSAATWTSRATWPRA